MANFGDNFIDIDMKTLDNIHAGRFYTDLVLNGHLIEETVEGQDEDGSSDEEKDDW